jgi:hypothetical protein
MRVLWAEFWRCGQRREDLGQFLLQPLVQDRIGTGSDAFDTNLSCRRVEEREQFGSPVLGVFMGLFPGFSFWLPMVPKVGNRLIGSCLILCPDGQPLLLGYGVGLLNQVFFPVASRSVTSTGPLLRTRIALPVSHQVRSCCHV